MEKNSYKLARQLSKDKSSRYELHKDFEKINVSASLSDKYQVSQSGYNCLHVSVLEDDVELTQQLLDQGVNLLQQGTQNGFTPLCAFITERPYDQDRNVNMLQGRLEKHPMVDLLLNEQVKKNQAINPKCLKGLSHLHIACMVDHLQAVEMFLKAGESVNQAVTSYTSSFARYTPLHMAVRYSSVNVAKLLIYHEADIHQKDAFGDSPLHKLIQRLILTADYINMGKYPMPLSPLVKELKQLEMIVGLIMTTRKEKEVNFADHLGLSAFHVACTLRDSFMAEDLLKENIDVNKPLTSGPHLWSGWTPLHFAACCSIYTVKLLIQHGADITVKTTKASSPLDMCTRRYNPAVIHSILSIKDEYREILLSDGSTKLLDLILAMDNCDEFNRFLQNMPDINAIVPLDSPIWPGYNVLHLAVAMHEKTKNLEDYAKKFVTPETTDFEKHTCSEDKEKDYWKRIVVCLARRCSLVAKNASGLTPVHLAFHLRKANVADKLLNCSLSSNEMDESNGLSFLHMACGFGKKNVVERFVADINTPVKADFEWCKEGAHSRIRANSTPLHIAVQFMHREITEFLLQQKNIDVYARDSLDFTPIHLSIVSMRMAEDFLSKITNLKEVVSQDGLSHLHVAVLANDDKAIETLVRNGAKVNTRFQPLDKFGKFIIWYIRDTPLHVAVKRRHSKAICALIQAGADIHAVGFRSKYDTPLQAAMQNEYKDILLQFVKKLRHDKRVKGPLEPCGVTLLHFACATFDIKWAKILLEKGADPNAQICINKDYQSDWKGFAPLHVMIARANCLKGKFEKLIDIAMLLLKYGADVTLQDWKGYSPVLMAEKFAVKALEDEEKFRTKNERKISGHLFTLADLLLKSQQSFAVNPATHRESLTHFHYACKTNKLEIVRKFLKNGIDVNHAKRAVWEIDGGYTPLHYALTHSNWNIAWLLLDHKADVTVRDVHGNTPLHIAVRHSNDVRLLEKLCSLGADVKAKNYDDLTPLDMLLSLDSISHDKFKFFLDRGCSIELDNESDVNVIGLLMSNADPFDRQNIFTLTFESCNLPEKIKEGFNAIKSLVGFNPKKEWKECRRWTVDMFIEAIQFFMKVGCDIDQQNSFGKTALHVAVTYCNVEAVEALLLLGATINPSNHSTPSPLAPVLLKSYKRPFPEYIRLKKICANYVWKMKFVGLEVINLDDETVESVWTDGYLDLQIKERCEDELKRLAKTKIGKNWTLKDFLLETKAVVEYQTLSLEERRPVDEFFKCHADLRKNFPEFCGLLMSQYRKVLQNDQLCESIMSRRY